MGGAAAALLLSSAVGCGTATTTAPPSDANDANDANNPTASSAPNKTSAAAPSDSGDADVHPALRPLLPAGSKPILQAMEAAPDDAAAVANAAEFYSKTDTAGMTLLWGAMYGAMIPSGPASEKVAAAISSVLRDRVSVTIDG